MQRREAEAFEDARDRRDHRLARQHVFGQIVAEALERARLDHGTAGFLGGFEIEQRQRRTQKCFQIVGRDQCFKQWITAGDRDVFEIEHAAIRDDREFFIERGERRNGVHGCAEIGFDFFLRIVISVLANQFRKRFEIKSFGRGQQQQERRAAGFELHREGFDALLRRDAKRFRERISAFTRIGRSGRQFAALDEGEAFLGELGVKTWHGVPYECMNRKRRRAS